jgi:signal transduction histidine kinase
MTAVISHTMTFMQPRRFWSFVRALWLPVLMVGLAFLMLREPLVAWLQGDDRYDQQALSEWVREARVYQTLPELAEKLWELKDRYRDLEAGLQNPDLRARPSNDEVQAVKHQLDSKREQIEVHLQSMCDPVTKVYPGRLPLFVVVYRLAVRFDDGDKPIVWDSGKPRQPKQYRELAPVKIHNRGVWADVDYQARIYARQQYNERQAQMRWRWLNGLGLLLAVVATVWFFLRLRRQRARELRHLEAEQQATAAERLRLEEALKRQEAERRQEEAERTALELKSQLFANIGIMAGSYAHNIKNLLVRPNDLLGRCLEQEGLLPEQGHMLDEVRQTLGTVTERLQQILQTVRRDPSRSERQLLDLNELVREMHQTWSEMAQSKWKLDLHLELDGGASQQMPIEGDRSHLQQALENLLFNARDATFEMRNHLRGQARKGNDKSLPTTISEPDAAGESGAGSGSQLRRQALIAAAAWKGEVWLRTRREGDRAVLEVEDNGIGMTEDVRRRCTQTHFSTKRDNALFAGLSAGMGLGLSFVAVILEHHRATMEIASEPLQGARFRVVFPLAG